MKSKKKKKTGANCVQKDTPPLTKEAGIPEYPFRLIDHMKTDPIFGDGSGSIPLGNFTQRVPRLPIFPPDGGEIGTHRLRAMQELDIPIPATMPDLEFPDTFTAEDKKAFYDNLPVIEAYKVKHEAYDKETLAEIAETTMTITKGKRGVVGTTAITDGSNVSLVTIFENGHIMRNALPSIEELRESISLGISSAIPSSLINRDEPSLAVKCKLVNGKYVPITDPAKRGKQSRKGLLTLKHIAKNKKK